MRFLLTSAGISNKSIHNALVDLLGKPIAESGALCIPTAVYAMPGGAGMAWRLINGRAATPLCELGWKSLGVLELTALPSIDEGHWVPMVQETDALLVGGGDVLYLCYWMRQSGLADLLPSLREAVYVGVSAGSMVMAPNVGEDFVGWKPPAGSDRALGLVDFRCFRTWITRKCRTIPWPRRDSILCGVGSHTRRLRRRPDLNQAVTRARARRRPITLRDLLDRLLRTRAGSCQNTVPMPGAGSGILKTWKPAGARTAACAPPWTCIT